MSVEHICNALLVHVRNMLLSQQACGGSTPSGRRGDVCD